MGKQGGNGCAVRRVSFPECCSLVHQWQKLRSGECKGQLASPGTVGEDAPHLLRKLLSCCSQVGQRGHRTC